MLWPSGGRQNRKRSRNTPFIRRAVVELNRIILMIINVDVSEKDIQALTLRPVADQTLGYCG
jgi:hypothetical protein